MDYVNLGNTGLKVSRFCLGCMSYGQATTGMMVWPWTLSEEDGRPFIKRALDLGVNFFDTANVYSDGQSESVLGRAIRDFTRRDEVVLDPFGGSGTTLVAAQKTGRRARLIEYDPAYCDQVLRRFQQVTGKQPRLAATGQAFEIVAECRSCDPAIASVERQVS